MVGKFIENYYLSNQRHASDRHVDAEIEFTQKYSVPAKGCLFYSGVYSLFIAALLVKLQ